MKWSIFELQKYRNEGILLEEVINMDELREVDKTIRKVSPIKVAGHVDIGANKFTFHLHITGQLTLPCSRTLLDVNFPIDIKTIETFVNLPYDERQEEDYDEFDFNYVEGNTIDLRDIIKELLIIEIPMQVYSDNVNEAEAAPQSGDGWEVVDSEEEQPDKIDPRLADLAKLLEKDDE